MRKQFAPQDDADEFGGYAINYPYLERTPGIFDHKPSDPSAPIVGVLRLPVRSPAQRAWEEEQLRADIKQMMNNQVDND